MNHGEANRRDFLKAAGLAAASAGFLRANSLSAAAFPTVKDSSERGEFKPFPSLASVFEAPRSQYFGVKTEERTEDFGNGQSGRRWKLVPRDPKTLYLADGISGEEEPHSFQLTFEITNNSILCSATQGGLLKNPCIFSRMVPSRRRGREFQAEELVGGSAWSFGLKRNTDRPVRLPMTHGAEVELLGSVFLLFKYRVDDLSVQLLAFAPRSLGNGAKDPRAIITVVKVQNQGEVTWEGSLLAPGLPDAAEPGSYAVSSPVESPHPRFTELPVPIVPGYEAVLSLNGTCWSPRCPEVHLAIRPGDQTICSFALLLGASAEELRATARHLQIQNVLDWFNLTWASCEERYGRLTIPAHPYFSENYLRLIESDSSAFLYSGEGRFFSGGPSGWADYGMLLFEPKYLADSLRTLAGYHCRPVGPPDKESLGYSLVNSLGLLPSAALYYRATGDRELFTSTPGILDFARDQLEDILSLRRGEPYLFSSKMLWDGPTLGDFHTGSNIMAWLAFRGMGRIAREVYNETQLGNRWEEIAVKIKQDIYRYCVGASRLGPRFFEGGYANGTFVPGHNGEEAFTTLAPFFGFCEPDDPVLINHAKLAFTPENPLYEPAVDGIWWGQRGDRYSGVTTPGQMAMLVANNDEVELKQRLEQLRGLTDLDGSIWWWPYLFPCNDRLNVRRRDWPVDTSKSGFSMAIAACLLVANVFGLNVDVPACRVYLRPFCPWEEFSWQGTRLGYSKFDFAYKREAKRITGRITNQNVQPFTAVIELMLQKGQSVQKATLNGEAAGGMKEITRFSRPAVKLETPVAPGMAAELSVTTV